MERRWNLWAAAALLGLAGIAGCTPNRQTDTAAERAGRNTVEAADRTGNRAANRTEGAFGELKKDARELAITAKVKNALMTTDQKLDWKGIDVDTASMTVHLKGTVPNAQQKALAEKIAKQQAGSDFKVMNHLRVAR